MRFEQFIPSERLRPHVKHFVVSENTQASAYKVFPSSGLVIGFQYWGSLSLLQNGSANNLAAAGITGIADSHKVFSNAADIGSILVYFTETGFAHFSSLPVHELFNQSVSLSLPVILRRTSSVGYR